MDWECSPDVGDVKCIQKFIGKFLGKRSFGRLRSCEDNMRVKEGGRRWHGIVALTRLSVKIYLDIWSCLRVRLKSFEARSSSK
jgi:hypothetical protein